MLIMMQMTVTQQVPGQRGRDRDGAETDFVSTNGTILSEQVTDYHPSLSLPQSLPTNSAPEPLLDKTTSAWFDARILREPAHSAVSYPFRWPPLPQMLPLQELLQMELPPPPTQTPEPQHRLPTIMRLLTELLLSRPPLNSERMLSRSEDSRADLLVLYAALLQKSPTAPDAASTGRSSKHIPSTVPGSLQLAASHYRCMFKPRPWNQPKR